MGYGQAIVVEAIATFLLVLTIMALAVDKRAPVGWAGLLIGLSVTCLVVVFGPQTGAAVNPARAFGPYATSALIGGEVPWSQFPAYVAGSLLGGLAAAVTYDLIARPRGADDAAEPAQGTQGDIEGRRVSEPDHARDEAGTAGDPASPRSGAGRDVRTDRSG